jgi:anti-sigma factor ChrR (cupin superfamily)
MELNADFSQRAVVHAASMAWAPSPMPGVERRMLDRIGKEVGHATTIVRYAAQSHYSAHRHDGGEEFLVLEGVFQDEHGEYPAGYYVRNPPTSRHTPGSAEGCTILVKLWQFAPDDRSHVRIDTGKMSFLPVPDRAGVERMPLFDDGREDVRLERWAPHAAIALASAGGIELLVLEGGFRDGGDQFAPHSWLRLPKGVALQTTAGADGCKLWVKTGHLARPKPAAAIRS